MAPGALSPSSAGTRQSAHVADPSTPGTARVLALKTKSIVRVSPHIFQAIQEELETIPLSALYIFGSFGTIRQHPGSDLDLALLPVVPINPVLLFELANILATRLNLDVDLVDLSTASTVMGKEVIRTGERLVVNDLNAAQIFEMHTLSDYARLNEERQPVLAR